MTNQAHSWIALLIACASAIVFAVVVTALAALVTRMLAQRAVRRREAVRSLSMRLRSPFRITLLLVCLWSAVAATAPVSHREAEAIRHVFLIAVIIAGAWLVGAFVLFLEDLATSRYRVDVPDNRVARRIRTQLLILRRLTIVVVVVIALAAVLLSFPEIRVVGASVLASAGLVSVIAGLAAQSTLGNVFAGVQLAFNGAIRVDDVVVVGPDESWGRIEEITLTYVVVHVWDDTRLVLPSTYFTTQPFQNWTRHSSQLLGEVDFDLDWQVDPVRMREELDRVLKDAPLWDHRASVLQVTDAVGGFVHVRVLVTAVDSATLFDLRCFVREALVRWIQEQSERAMPRQRVVVADHEPVASAAKPAGETPGLFSGSEEGDQRAERFAGGEEGEQH